MELDQLITSKRDQILHIARKHGADNIRLFGSAARGELGPSSDVDILVEMRSDHSPWFPAGLIADLEELLGRRVHVVTVKALHPYIRDRVVQDAVPL
ncbi:MAG: nucleotidyltransferase family protein [Thermodesulfobacteriota bacterium]